MVCLALEGRSTRLLLVSNHKPSRAHAIRRTYGCYAHRVKRVLRTDMQAPRAAACAQPYAIAWRRVEGTLSSPCPPANGRYRDQPARCQSSGPAAEQRGDQSEQPPPRDHARRGLRLEGRRRGRAGREGYHHQQGGEQTRQEAESCGTPAAACRYPARRAKGGFGQPPITRTHDRPCLRRGPDSGCRCDARQHSNCRDRFPRCAERHESSRRRAARRSS